MPITRKFMDWQQPALITAAEYLFDGYLRKGQLNLEKVVIVLPGKRAGRRLTELLVERAEQRGVPFYPPMMVTAGNFPELLYEPKLPFASDLTQQLAWVKVLREMQDEVAALLLPHPPADDDFAGWLELGALLWRQHRELAADGHDFGDVVQYAQQLAGAAEARRWQQLQEIQQAYLRTLDSLSLWDLQTARLYAIKHRECRTDRDIVLLATADMNQAMRRMLDQVADRVVSLIFAPPSEADRFDQHGCLIPEAWAERPIDIADRQIHVVEGPADQADAAARCLVQFSERYAIDEVSVGVPDEQLVLQLTRRLARSGVRTRWLVGRTLQQSGPFRLLAALADFLERGRFADFAALVRHPDVHDWITGRVGGYGWLVQLDRYYMQHLQPRLGTWLGNEKDCHWLQQAEAELQQAVESLRGPPRTLDQWTSPIAGTLRTFYEGRIANRDEPAAHDLLEACRLLREALLEMQAVPRTLASQVTAVEAIRLLLGRSRTQGIISPPDSEAVELLGWLELPLDDKPALVVTSLNEGFVPKSVNSDLFLPNRLRRKLHVVDNARRYARDVYALSALLASREQVRFIVGRRDAEGNPLTPSRLLFAADREVMARRAWKLFRSQAADPEQAADAEHAAAGRDEDAARTARVLASGLAVPTPQPLQEPIAKLAVTSFRSYLQCPYRFYLSRILRLETLHDEAQELDASVFGKVIHDALQQFGESDLRRSTDPAQIRRFLHHAVDQYLDSHYGKYRLPAVNFQAQRMIARLDAFAQWQADWAARGWRIEYTEQAMDAATDDSQKPVCLHLSNDHSVLVSGRIDRIDVNEHTGQWAVLDYKTGNNASEPDKTHRRGGAWVDLQLPLYRHYMRCLGINDPVHLGYVTLGKDLSQIKERLADWTDEELAEADEVAIEVATCIVQQEFWPPVYPVPWSSELAGICQDDVFDRLVEQTEKEAAT